MKRTLSILLLFGLFVILSVSCGRLVANTETATPESSRNWQMAWLDQPVCKPPCWQNITPGVTTKNEAMSILENTPGIVITYNDKIGIDWIFGTKTEGGEIISSDDGIVSGVWLSSINKDLYLKKVVAVYGFPKYVKPYDCRVGMCSTVLIYPDLGMLLTVFVENKGMNDDKPFLKILPETIVDRVYFIEQGMENFQKLIFFQDYDLLMEWKGYGEYP